MNPLIKVFLFGTALPFLVSLTLLAGPVLVRNKRFRMVMPGFAVALGYAAAHVALTGWQGFPPADVTQWLPWIAILCAISGAALVSFPRAALPVAGAVGLTALFLVLKPLLANTWNLRQSTLAITAGILCIAIVLLILTSAIKDEHDSPAAGAVMVVTFSAASIALLRSNSALLGQLAGAFAAATGAFVSISIFWRNYSYRSLNPACSIVTVILLLLGTQYASLPRVSAYLLLATILPVLLLRVHFVRNLSTDSRFIRRSIALVIPVVVSAIPAALAVYIAMKASPALEL